MDEKKEHKHIPLFGYLMGALLFVSFFYISIFWNSGNIFATTCTSAQNGDWNATSTWTGCGDLVPQVGDSVIISSGKIVTIPSGHTINQVADVTVQGTLNQNGIATQTISGTLTVEDGAYIGHGGNSTTQENEFDFVVGNLDVQSGGNISVNLAGFDGGYYDAALGEENNWGNGYGDGAGHAVYGEAGGGGAGGGTGGTGTGGGVGGEPYSIAEAPTLVGYGGAGAYLSQGGEGGGYAKIAISGGGTATIDGGISANGGGGLSADADNHAGGGSGGSIWIDFLAGGAFAGSGTIVANGGNSETSGDGGTKDGGSGSGGRITVVGYTTSTFSGSISNNGGNVVDWNSGLDVCCEAGASHGDAGSIVLSLTGADVEPQTIYVGETGTTTVSFTTSQDISEDAIIEIVFGAGFDVSGVGESDATCSSMDGTSISAPADQSVFIVRLGDGTTESAGPQTCSIANVVNPASEGTTAPYSITVSSYNGASGEYNLIDIDDSISGDTFVVANATPTTSIGIASQTNANIVTVTTTVSDTNNDVTSLIVEYSNDGNTWASSTLGIVTADEGTVTTSTGQISSIDTNIDGSVDLVIMWSVGTDLPNVVDSSVYLRVIPNDGTINGTSASTTAFAIDTTSPSAPSALAVDTVGATSVILTLPTTTSTDDSFGEYKIYYDTTTTVTEADTAFTSTTDSNLANSDFNGNTTTTISELSPNVVYFFKIFAYDSIGNVTSSVDYVSVTTLANTAGAPTIDTPTTSTLNITVSQNDNNSLVKYAMYNETDGNYVNRFGASTAVEYFALSIGWTSKTLTGLTPNTQYQFSTVSRNSALVTSVTSSLSTAIYTLASVPTSLSATADSDTQVTLSWTGDGTSYTISDTVSDIASGETSMSHTVTGLTCNTTYTFKVKAFNGDGEVTAYSDTSQVTTNACPSGGALISVPPQVNPITILEDLEIFDLDFNKAKDLSDIQKQQQKVNGDIIKVSIPVGSGFSFGIGDIAYSIVVRGVQGDQILMTLFSEQIDFDIAVGYDRSLDVDHDGVVDVNIFVKGIGIDGKIAMEITDLNDMPILVNGGSRYTDDAQVTVRIRPVDNVIQVALSEYEDFSGASYQSFQEISTFEFVSEPGLKTVYAKLRTDKGGTTIISDTIELKSKENICPVKIGKPYRYMGHSGVYYITEDCTKRSFINSQYYFSYFTSWDDVITVSKKTLESIVDDEKGSMLYGSRYIIPDDTLIKTIDKAPVYLFTDDLRHWITTPEVFESLGYVRSQIVDVSESLLNMFERGSDIGE